MKTELEAQTASVPIHKTHTADVVVAGGGMAGIGAALASAGCGVDTLLVERYGFMGGTATAAAVVNFQAGPNVDGQPVIRGIYEDICRRMHAAGGMESSHRFNPEILKLVLFDLCEERGVRVLLHSFLCGARVDAGKIRSALIATKSGHAHVKADIFIDASGDGDLAAFAGAQFAYGREDDRNVQPMTLEFQICGFDPEKLKEANYKDLWSRFVEETGVTTSRGKIMPNRAGGGSKLAFNMTHVNSYSGLDAEELASAEHLGRKQAFDILQFFRRRVPGCENAVFASTGAQIGVRETRRIYGDYVMAREDVLEARHFDDTIGRSTSWIDIHSPVGVGVLHEYVPKNHWFEIPYRALLPRGLQNLYVVGRCMSVTHEALGALREMPTCALTGEAAGVAAALCVQNKCHTRDLDIRMLQAALTAASLDGQRKATEPAAARKAGSQEQPVSEGHSEAMAPLISVLKEIAPYFDAKPSGKIPPDQTRLRICVYQGQIEKPVYDRSFPLETIQRIVQSLPEQHKQAFRSRSINLDTSLRVAAALRNVIDHEMIDYQEVTDRLKVYVTAGETP